MDMHEPADHAADGPAIALADRFNNPVPKMLCQVFGPLLETALGIDEFNLAFAKVARRYSSEEEADFFKVAMEVFGARYEITAGQWARLPAEGPTIVVANHAFGFLDALVLGHMLSRRREDVRILASREVAGLTGASQWMIGIDLTETPESANRNEAAMRMASRHVSEGGMLAVFPAVEVAYFRPRNLGIREGEWKASVGRVILETGASVTPVHFSGSNSLGYQALGGLNAELRNLLLPRELLKNRDKEVRVTIGKLVSARTVRGFDSEEGLMAFLRARTLALRSDAAEVGLDPGEPGIVPTATEGQEESLAPSLSPFVSRNTSALAQAAFRSEVEDLPPCRILARQRELVVCLAHACEIPWILQEIGWLREQAFREIGEGTGKALDLDRFDQHYEHLFLFNEETCEIVGAYRLARTDLVMATEGIGGLYTHTLFKYDRSFLDAVSPALELGRSFVRKEYQRSTSVLPLIWRGIGAYVARSPQYATLFGPVSISQEYLPISRSLIVDFLDRHHKHPGLSGKVNGRKGFRSAIPDEEIARCDISELNSLSAVLSDIEDDGKGLPILLKHYLKLNGQLLSFNVDPEFANALDGLILVDLRETSPVTIRRYLGRDGYATFCHYHGLDAAGGDSPSG